MDGMEGRSSWASGRTGFRTGAGTDRRASRKSGGRPADGTGRHRARPLRGAEHRAPARRGRVRALHLRGAERGSVTVEHAIGLIAVVGMIGLVVCAAQASITSTALCQAVRDGARAASIGEENPQTVATTVYAAGSYTLTRGDGLVTVTGTASYQGIGGWVGGQARCSVTTIDEENLP